MPDGPPTAPTTPAIRTCLVGLGTIGRTHVAAMPAHPGLVLTAVVDPVADPADVPDGVRLARDLNEVMGDVDLVVIATPSDTHADLTVRVLEGSTATVLVEKPLVTDLDQLQRLLAAVGRTGPDRVRTAHHFIFSPEVRWTVDGLRQAGWGPPAQVTCGFFDPYIDDLPARRASLASSWLDSGVNQLSVVSRFVDIDGLTALDHTDEGVASTTRLGRPDGGTEVLLLTDWRSAGSSKQTTLAWPTEDRQVLMDHTAMAATVIDGGRVVDAFRVADGTPRAIAHYRGLYATLAEAPDHDDLGLATAVRIMRVLHA